MMTRTRLTPRTLLIGLSLAGALALACTDDEKRPTGLGATDLSLTADTVSGTGALAELQQRRAAWVARRIDDYRVQLKITCFCGGEITRPVLLEVRGGAVSKVWDLETGRSVENLAPYPTITALFDKAIAERAGGGHVSVAYDTVHGFPVRLEIGTLANDAGTEYTSGDLRPL